MRTLFIKEVTENVTYLGRRGVYTTTNGLSIAYISGVFGDGMSNEPHCYTETDLNILQAQSGVMNGIDILITSQWPSDVLRYVKKPDFKAINKDLAKSMYKPLPKNK